MDQAIHTLRRETFLGLVDDVLVAVGRQPLKLANQAIVEVREDDRVLQILAGPGSGKTEMLVWRVLYELFVIGTPANRVMVTTFTRKAATELGVRLVERSDLLIQLAHEKGLTVLDPHVHDLRLGTIHSLCETLLAEFDTDYMASGTQLIDETEAMVRMVREHRWIINTRGENPPLLDRLLQANELVCLFRAPWDGTNWPGNTFQKMRYVTALLAQHTETWGPRCAGRSIPNGVEALHQVQGLTNDLNTLRERWTHYLEQQQILDFTTLQNHFYERQQSFLAEIEHVLVDEFQDTNPIQFSIHTGWLLSPGVRLTVVGDDDQAMYRFRGSDFECFKDIRPFCGDNRIPYRLEKLEENWRSTRAIVGFSQAFKRGSVLQQVSMPKLVRAAPRAVAGAPVRLLCGPWDRLCAFVAQEIAARTPAGGAQHPDTGCLFFSTSEKGASSRIAPARILKHAVESAGLRVYNARNKTAAQNESPVSELLALLSYLIDPVSKAPAGAGGRYVEVWASMPEEDRAGHARSERPRFRISSHHAGFQKAFVKAEGGKVGIPTGTRKELVDFIDQIRSNLIKACATEDMPRLTIAGLVARILSFPRYRDCGYTVELFRQALFTDLLESNIAPTRRTKNPLDAPLVVQLSADGKFVWDEKYWSFLHVFGTFLHESDLDDPEVEAFEDNAVVLLTYHQSKGLEFDHVYIAGTGRTASPNSVLQTLLFSGKTPAYVAVAGQPVSSDPTVQQLSEADRDREIYVALTRAKKTLTILHDPQHSHPLMGLNPVLSRMRETIVARPLHPDFPDVHLQEFSHE